MAGGTTPSLDASLGDVVEPGDNVLLLAPSLSAESARACLALLTVTDPADEVLLSCTFHNPRTHVQHWNEQVDGLPASARLVNVSEVSDEGRDLGVGGLEDVLDVTRTNPDLTGMGIALNQAFEASEDHPEQTVFCFSTVTALLQYADLERVFRFLDVLTQRARAADAVAHYHLDPAAHDEQTVATLTHLFDLVVEVTPSGSVEIRGEPAG
ncbi:MAG: hypothetical protein ABEI31_05930 [Halodesulfurarchaeum sp.]